MRGSWAQQKWKYVRTVSARVNARGRRFAWVRVGQQSENWESVGICHLMSFCSHYQAIFMHICTVISEDIQKAIVNTLEPSVIHRISQKSLENFWYTSGMLPWPQDNVQMYKSTRHHTWYKTGGDMQAYSKQWGQPYIIQPWTSIWNSRSWNMGNPLCWMQYLKHSTMRMLLLC